MTTITQIAIAKARGLINVEPLATACDTQGLPFHLGCTILEKESRGANVFGHDAGGAMYGAGEVTEAKYRQFRRLIDAGQTSNGVGPMQITWKGYFPDAEARGFQLWIPADNIRYGVDILAKSYRANLAKGQPMDTAWWNTAKAYNGGSAYADDALAKAKEWKAALTGHTLLSLNCQWPGFASTTGLPWPMRCPMLASAIQRSGATIVAAQELGKAEAAHLATLLPGWRYQRAEGGGVGLNCVFWSADWTLLDQRDWDIQSFGQMQRTLLAVQLQHKDGTRLWVASTHFAAAASDLSEADAIEARKAQAVQVGTLLAPLDTVVLCGDWNSSYPAWVANSVRYLLAQQGFVFGPPLGIDGIGAKLPAELLSETIYPLGDASDHDGRLAVCTAPVVPLPPKPIPDLEDEIMAMTPEQRAQFVDEIATRVVSKLLFTDTIPSPSGAESNPTWKGISYWHNWTNSLTAIKKKLGV